MIVLTDDRVITILSGKFNIPANRIIYGQLEVAQNHWVRYCETNSIPNLHPYMAFYHTVRFHEEDRMLRKAQVVDGDPATEEKQISYTPCFLEYVVEIIGSSIVDQIEYIRKYFIWVNGNAHIEYTDDQSQTWKFKMVGEDPEDNSDLEAEEDTGRVVRTTFTFRVDTFILEEASVSGYITEVLQNIHLYE